MGTSVPEQASVRQPRPTPRIALQHRTESEAVHTEPTPVVSATQYRSVDIDWPLVHDTASDGQGTASTQSPSPHNAGDATEAPVQTVPVLARATRRASERRREYIELPPPPEWEGEERNGSDAPAFGAYLPVEPIEDGPPSDRSTHRLTTSLDRRDHAAAQHRQRELEAEILNLRREVDRLVHSQRIALQLDRLEHAQKELLQLQHELPGDQVLQLLHSILEELHAIRETLSEVTGPSPRRGSGLDGAAD